MNPYSNLWFPQNTSNIQFSFLQKQSPEVFYKKRCCNLRPATLLKKRLCSRCFPVNFTKFLRTPFLQNCFFIRLLLFLVYIQILWSKYLRFHCCMKLQLYLLSFFLTKNYQNSLGKILSLYQSIFLISLKTLSLSDLSASPKKGKLNQHSKEQKMQLEFEIEVVN